MRPTRRRGSKKPEKKQGIEALRDTCKYQAAIIESLRAEVLKLNDAIGDVAKICAQYARELNAKDGGFRVGYEAKGNWLRYLDHVRSQNRKN